jgi:molybdopterin synthase catalytic subunit
MITHELIDTAQFLSRQPDPSCGASASFVGIVRNEHDGKAVERLFYECYEPMAEKQIEGIAARAKTKWSVRDIQVIHRVGWLDVGEVAIAILVHSGHRDEAFSACREVIDEIKRTVPIWKREVYRDGTEQWVSCEHAGRHSSRR